MASRREMNVSTPQAVAPEVQAPLDTSSVPEVQNTPETDINNDDQPNVAESTVDKATEATNKPVESNDKPTDESKVSETAEKTADTTEKPPVLPVINDETNIDIDGVDWSVADLKHAAKQAAEVATYKQQFQAFTKAFETDEVGSILGIFTQKANGNQFEGYKNLVQFANNVLNQEINQVFEVQQQWEKEHGIKLTDLPEKARNALLNTWQNMRQAQYQNQVFQNQQKMTTDQQQKQAAEAKIEAQRNDLRNQIDFAVKELGMGTDNESKLEVAKAYDYAETIGKPITMIEAARKAKTTMEKREISIIAKHKKSQIDAIKTAKSQPTKKLDVNPVEQVKTGSRRIGSRSI